MIGYWVLVATVFEELFNQQQLKPSKSCVFCVFNDLRNPNPLTFSAVLSLPARVAYDLSALATGEVSKCVVSGSTEDGATLAVVVLITQEAIRVTQLRPA